MENNNINLTYEDRIIEQYDTEIAEAEEYFNTLSFDPKYDGIIVFKYIKCGKKGCKCSLDLDRRILHGPYPHFQYRDANGVLHQKYLNRKNVREYREKVDMNTEYKNARRKLNRLKKKKKEYLKEIKLGEQNSKEDRE